MGLDCTRSGPRRVVIGADFIVLLVAQITMRDLAQLRARICSVWICSQEPVLRCASCHTCPSREESKRLTMTPRNIWELKSEWKTCKSEGVLSCPALPCRAPPCPALSCAKTHTHTHTHSARARANAPVVVPLHDHFMTPATCFFHASSVDDWMIPSCSIPAPPSTQAVPLQTSSKPETNPDALALPQLE